jgi:hypothetical protein
MAIPVYQAQQELVSKSLRLREHAKDENSPAKRG